MWKLQTLVALIAGIAALVAVADAQVGNPPPLQPVTIQVTATDHAGNPVTDLGPADLRIVDDGSPQAIKSLRLNRSQEPAVAILFDVMDLSFQQRGFATNQLQDSLAGVPLSARLCLYLLTADGGVYPVYTLRGSEAPPPALGDASWIEHVGPLLDQALRRVPRSETRI